MELKKKKKNQENTDKMKGSRRVKTRQIWIHRISVLKSDD